MGINGLIPFLKEASRRTDVSEFAGKTVAIDSYCWLHRGAFACAEKLTLGEHTDVYVTYCMNYVNMLLSHSIKPILVFDGRQLPAKALTEAKRRENRKANRAKAIELKKMGNDTEADKLMKRTLHVTHEMALQLIKQCQSMNVDCIVAPYEADSELAYLNISGIADVIITEDSDLLLFGCKKVLFKMDVHGHGLLIDQEELYRAMDTSREDFSMDDFVHMCILSGCDYLPSLHGIGLAKARKFIKSNPNCDIYNALTELGSSLNMKSLVVPQEYRDAFILAIITFKHQLVYCPLKRRQVRLNPPPPSVTSEQLKHAGEEIDPETAFQLALGNYDPSTFEKLHDFDPDKAENQDVERHQRPSIWSKRYKLTSNSDDSPPNEESVLMRSNVVNNPTSRLKQVELVDREDNFECNQLNQQEILNVYESGSSTDFENSPNKAPLEIKGSPDMIKRHPILKLSSVDSPSARSSSNTESPPNDEPTSPILARDKIWASKDNETSPSFLDANVYPESPPNYEPTSPILARDKIWASKDNETSPSFLDANVYPESPPNYEPTSPILAKDKIWPSDDNETSPSLLDANVDRVRTKYMRRGRRVRRRIVSPGVTVESKYFAETTETSVTNEEKTDIKEILLETENIILDRDRKVHDFHSDSLEESNEEDLRSAVNEGPSLSQLWNEYKREKAKRNMHLNTVPMNDDDTNKLDVSHLSIESEKENYINKPGGSRMNHLVNEPAEGSDRSKLHDLNGSLTSADVDPDYSRFQQDDVINCHHFGSSEKKIHRDSPSNKMKRNKSYSNSRTNIYGKAKDGTRRKQVGLEKGQQSLLNFFEAKQRI